MPVQTLTVRLIELIPGQVPAVMYMMEYVPAPAAAGSNVPMQASAMPGPDQVPPLVAATRLIAAPLSQSIPGSVMVASSIGLMVTVTGSMSMQLPFAAW